MPEFKPNQGITRTLSEYEKACQCTIALFYTPLTNNDLLFAEYSQLGGDCLGILVFFRSYRASDGSWSMDHWVSVLSFLTLAGPGKNCLILFRNWGFGGFMILDFLSGAQRRNSQSLSGWFYLPRLHTFLSTLSAHAGQGPDGRPKKWLHESPAWWAKEFIGVTQRSMGNSQAKLHHWEAQPSMGHPV